MRNRPFNWRTRQENLAGPNGVYDVVIVGGGIVGCGTALEAAQRGYSVLLLEKGDLGSGTSSRTSRLIHGGLRYLRQGRVRLVHEATRERYWLRTHFSHLVRPVEFLIPFYEGLGEGPPAMMLGLWLYDLVSGWSNVRRNRRLKPVDCVAREPGLRREGLLGGALYYDCMTVDSRLVLVNATMAHKAGAQVIPYAKVEGFEMERDRVSGVTFRDLLTDQVHTVEGRTVVNAAGPWGDELRSKIPQGTPSLRLTKGVHIFLQRSLVGNQGAVVMRSPEDQRIVFALPWEGLTLVGTTDTDFSGAPEDARAEKADILYLLDVLNFTFPGARLTFKDVMGSYAGVRPLVARFGVPESDVSRGFKVIHEAPGLISALGGKLTTYRSEARRIVDRIGRDLGGKGHSRSERGQEEHMTTLSDLDVLREELGAAKVELEEEVVEHILQTYGKGVRDLIGLLKEPGLRKRILPSLPYLLGEVVYALNNEMALRLEDIMVRRTGIAYEAKDHGVAVSGRLAALMAEHLGWSESQTQANLDEFREYVASMEAFRRERPARD